MESAAEAFDLMMTRPANSSQIWQVANNTGWDDGAQNSLIAVYSKQWNDGKCGIRYILIKYGLLMLYVLIVTNGLNRCVQCAF
ncbi:MAG: hypothetical protein WAM14_08790 [Candidatus Nitrosopolaris sp.]